MFNKISIKNVLGINKKIDLDFMASPKQKEKKNSVFEIEPYVNINKVIGIIGPNASGKSSIIDALIELRIFLEQYEIIESLKKSNSEEMKKLLDNYNNETEGFLPDRNYEKLSEKSEISIEMYIPTGEIPGYYKYSLVYDDKILNETLIYRKKFKSEKEILVEDYKTDTKRSDIGYKCNYKDSIIKDYENVDKKLVDKFNETLKYYNTFYKYFVGRSFFQTNGDYSWTETIDYVKNNKDVILKLLKLVDSKICDITLSKNNAGGEKLIFHLHNSAKLEWIELSTGTKNMINLFVSIMKTIENEGIMICDEIETSLHKELVQLIINLFLTSNNSSQLIFTTHEPEILDKSGMRNEQKYFLHYKNGQTEAIKISDINPRSDYSFSKNYYTDERFMPQPTKEKINEFCKLVNGKKE